MTTRPPPRWTDQPIFTHRNRQKAKPRHIAASGLRHPGKEEANPEYVPIYTPAILATTIGFPAMGKLSGSCQGVGVDADDARDREATPGKIPDITINLD